MKWTAGLVLLLLACGRGLPTEGDARRALSPLAGHATAAGWPARAEAVRAGIRRGARLEVFDRHSPLQPRSTGLRVRDGHSIENVAFEAWPGFFVTGNLYRPAGAARFPALLLPHGHFREAGWFARTRPQIQAAAATLAEMGVAVFAYDMVGWGDSQQVPHDHRSVLALQLWNGIRAVDYLLTIPGVDARRLAVAGASGGGSQALLLAAVDDRIAATAVLVMLSAAFPGGDGCENGMPVRTGSNNAEIAATLAPRPLLVVSTGHDWTHTVPTVELPYLRAIYDLAGAPDRVEAVHLPDEGHDDGPSKRLALYRFIARVFGVPLRPEYRGVEPHESLIVFPDAPPSPVALPPGL
jgi:hypothetical protein